MEVSMQEANDDLLLKESLSFLRDDFVQCFEHLRHYDTQIIDILKFTFTVYGVVAGIVFGVYRPGLFKKSAFFPLAIASLLIGLVIGLLMLGIIVRNRAYFVKVARYMNENRRFYLENNPLGFKNISGMYMDSQKPYYFNWYSSQSFVIYTQAAINSFLLGELIYIILSLPNSWTLIFSISASLILLVLQLYLIIKYLKKEERCIN